VANRISEVPATGVRRDREGKRREGGNGNATVPDRATGGTAFRLLQPGGPGFTSGAAFDAEFPGTGTITAERLSIRNTSPGAAGSSNTWKSSVVRARAGR